MIRVLIADDHNLVRAGLRLLMDEMPGLDVVGEAADGNEALRLIESLKPDVVLMDVAMPGLNGIEAVRRANRQWPDIRILILSMHADEAYVYEAMKAGAAGYLLKGADKAELEQAIRTVVRNGDTYLTPAITHTVVSALAAVETRQSPLDVLTSRQREILQLIAEGRTTRQIALRLNLSAKTVESHRANLMARLGIRDVPGLVRFAIRVGLIAGDR
jgi:DNA-binding NarL/FixJ family response regulator